jgi:hypothetical protein
MDFEGLLQSVIRFSNFMTSRLVVSGLFFYVVAGFTDIGSSTEGILPNLDLMNNVIQNYQNIFDILGVSDFALLLIFFLFLTAIHLTYIAFERIGGYIPPAIVPLSGWSAIDDLTASSFVILREARGEEHSDEENQRIFEFSRKLEAINAANEAEYAEELATTYAAYNVSKSFIVFSFGAWVWAVVSGTYSGDTIFLLVMLSLAICTALITTLAIFRAHHGRIDELRTEVTHQLLGFSSIWLPTEHQARMVETTVPSRDLRAASFAVLMPVYGTLEDFKAEIRRWRDRHAARRASTLARPK